jgi:glycosyltransferase involved in cell wall biosynthesis
MINKKIAIFHNYLDNIGGAEMVTLTLAKELDADIYTTNIDFEKIKKMGFDTKRIFSIGKVPINTPFKQQIASIKFLFLNLKNKYDLYIISGDWAYTGSYRNKPNIYYVHSPIRELWDSYLYARKFIVSFYMRPIFDIWVFINRILNKKIINNVDKFIANSENVKNRIKKYWNKESIVINPPIDCAKFLNSENKNNNYWLSVNRLFTNKRIDIQIETFTELKNKKLIIVGSYENSKHFKKYAEKIKSSCPDNVEILHWVNEDELIKLYKECTGFITTSKDEDFGMSAVEAMAAGKPVIAPNEGGYKESVIDKETGILINNISPEKISDAILEIESNLEKNHNFYYEKCTKRANDFDVKKFTLKILGNL